MDAYTDEFVASAHFLHKKMEKTMEITSRKQLCAEFVLSDENKQFRRLDGFFAKNISHWNSVISALINSNFPWLDKARIFRMSATPVLDPELKKILEQECKITFADNGLIMDIDSNDGKGVVKGNYDTVTLRRTEFNGLLEAQESGVKEYLRLKRLGGGDDNKTADDGTRATTPAQFLPSPNMGQGFKPPSMEDTQKAPGLIEMGAGLQNVVKIEAEALAQDIPNDTERIFQHLLAEFVAACEEPDPALYMASVPLVRIKQLGKLLNLQWIIKQRADQVRLTEHGEVTAHNIALIDAVQEALEVAQDKVAELENQLKAKDENLAQDKAQLIEQHEAEMDEKRLEIDQLRRVHDEMKKHLETEISQLKNQLKVDTDSWRQELEAIQGDEKWRISQIKSAHEETLRNRDNQIIELKGNLQTKDQIVEQQKNQLAQKGAELATLENEYEEERRKIQELSKKMIDTVQQAGKRDHLCVSEPSIDDEESGTKLKKTDEDDKEGQCDLDH